MRSLPSVAWLMLSLCACGARTEPAVDSDAQTPAPPADTRCEGGPSEAVRLLDDARGAAELAVFGESVYWASWFSVNAELGVVQRDGGDAHVLAERQDAPSAIEVDASGAWWLTSSQLVRLRSGGAVDVVEGGLNQPGDLVLASRGELFIANGSNSGSLRDEGIGEILRRDRAGLRLLAGDLGLPTHLTVDERAVYWVDLRRGLVSMVPRDGGDVRVLADGLDSPRDVEISMGTLYFSEDAERVLAMPVSGGAPVLLVASPVRIRDIEVDADHVYFAGHHLEDHSTGGVYRVPRTGGATEVMDEGHVVFGLALDATRVYWTRGAESEVWTRCKIL